MNTSAITITNSNTCTFKSSAGGTKIIVSKGPSTFLSVCLSTCFWLEKISLKTKYGILYETRREKSFYFTTGKSI